MNISEAERFFKNYGGHHFHMGREEPDNYAEYRSLGVSEADEEQWRQDLLGEMLGQMKALSKDTWCVHSHFIDALKETKTLREENILKMLEVMPDFTGLDLQQKTLIIENIAGRSGGMADDGILWLVCKYDNCTSRLKAVMEEIFASCGTDSENEKEFKRYCAAVNEYKNKLRAYERKSFCTCIKNKIFTIFKK